MVNDCYHKLVVLAGLRSKKDEKTAQSASSFEKVLENRLNEIRADESKDAIQDISVHIKTPIIEEYVMKIIFFMEKIEDVGSDIGFVDLKALQTSIELVLLFGMYMEMCSFGSKLSERFKIAMEESEKKPFTTRLTFRICKLLAKIFKMQHLRALKDKYLMDLYAGYFSLYIENQITPSQLDSFIFEADTPPKVFVSLNQLMSFLDPKQECVENSTLIVRKLISKHLSTLLAHFEVLDTFLFHYFPTEEALDDEANKKIAMITRLVLTPPVGQNISTDEYHIHIAKQVKALLGIESISLGHLRSVLSHISFQLYLRTPTHFSLHVLNPILKPFVLFYSQKPAENEDLPKDLDENVILASEEAILASLHSINCLLNEPDPSNRLCSVIAPVIPPLFVLYSFAFNHKIPIQESIFDILSQILNQMSDVDLSILLTAILDLQEYRHKAIFSLGSTRSPHLVYVETQEPQSALSGEGLIRVFRSIADPNKKGIVFVQVLTKYFYFSRQNIDPSDELLANNAQPFSMEILKVVLFFLEHEKQEIVSQPALILDFVRAILQENRLLKTKEDESDESFVLIVVTLLDSIFASEDWITAKALENVEQIQVALQCLTSQVNEELQSKLASVLLVMNLLLKQPPPYKEKQSSEDHQRRESAKCIREAVRDLANEELPIRAYGLNRLTHLVLKRDLVAFAQISELLDLVLDQLKNDDSFVYLHAVKALSAMTDVCPTQSLQHVTRRYTDSNCSLDERLRVGEALLQTIQRSGDVFANYANSILPALLKTLCDDELHIRTSALSLLSTAIETNPFSISPFLSQIVDYVHHALIFESAVESRRALLFLLLNLILAFNHNFNSLLHNTLLNTIKIDLEFVIATDNDIICREHAQTALSRLKLMVFEMI